MNNHGREAQKFTRKVGCYKSILLFSYSKLHLFIPSCLPARPARRASPSLRGPLAGNHPPRAARSQGVALPSRRPRRTPAPGAPLSSARARAAASALRPPRGCPSCRPRRPPAPGTPLSPARASRSPGPGRPSSGHPSPLACLALAVPVTGSHCHNDLRDRPRHWPWPAQPGCACAWQHCLADSDSE